MTNKIQNNELYRLLYPVFQSVLALEAIEITPAVCKSFKQVYIPLLSWIAKQQMQTPLIVGINGAQGSGKTTLVKVLKKMLETAYGKSVVILSLDNFYKTRASRLQMAKRIHPLFKTRGVPGTHDVELGIGIIEQLKTGVAERIALPVFDKSIDDRMSHDRWPSINGRVDIVLFEGWCVGAIAEPDSDIPLPINDLERQEDRKAIWRNYVNCQLSQEYRRWFALLDCLVMLQIPDYRKIFLWRRLQEQKLAAKLGAKNKEQKQLMTDAQLSRFIMHYERITRIILKEMPSQADLVLPINDEHIIERMLVKKI